MKSTKRLLLPLILTTLTVGPVFAVLRILLMTNYYDTEEKLYKFGTDLPEIFLTVLALTFLIIGVCALFIKTNNFNTVLPEANIPITFSGAFCGFLFISSTVLQGVYFAPAVFSHDKGAFKILFVLMLVFGLMSSLYFFKVSATSKLNFLDIKYLSFCPMLWAIFYLIFTYFDESVIINNPERELVHLAAITSMLFFTAESRYHLGIAKPKIYFSIAMISAVAIFAISVPNVILTASGTLGFTTHTIYSFCQIGILLYIITRLFSFTTAKEHIGIAKAEG